MSPAHSPPITMTQGPRSSNQQKHRALLSRRLGLISLFFLAHILKFFQTDGLKWKLHSSWLCPKQMPHNHNHINKAGKSEYEKSETGGRRGEKKKANNLQNVSPLIECSCLERGFPEKSEASFSLSKLRVIPFLLLTIFYGLGTGREKGDYLLKWFWTSQHSRSYLRVDFQLCVT